MDTRVFHDRNALLIVIAALPALAQAQGITRDNYHEMIPPKPRIIGQTNASAALHLFGDTSDSSYRDADPVDGIDDVRARRLLALAERFSPILRRNNVSVPRDPADIFDASPVLHVDRWENGRRIRSDSIPLGPQVTLAAAGGSPDGGEADSDRRLATLIATVGPRATISTVTSPDEEPPEPVFFFDMPGHDPASWRAAAKAMEGRRSRIFAHPFLFEDRAAASDARYHVVLQYWFFYTLNNSVNNHEGDWEHINVIVTTRARADAAVPREYGAARLSREGVERLLDPEFPLDSATIAAVEYHFHHHLLTLDYLARRMVREDTNAQHDHGPRYVWEDVDLPSRAIADRLALAGGRLATHPLAYVGGNYKGPAELLALRPRFRGSYRRNSHGSYPFPGTWQTVGPLGLTEQVHGTVVPPVRDAADVPWDSLITDRYYVAYRSRDILLLPDWERLESLVATQAEVRRKWAWMLLPVHWGFPAVPSLGAGTMKHVNMGNVAPLSPPYQPTWNRVGPAAGRSRYVPRVLRTPVSPTTPWALLRNGWGFLNVPFAAWGLMPGYNVALIELMPWVGGALHIMGAPPPRTYTSAQLPHRFTTEGQGAFWEFGGRDFASMLPYDSASAAAPTAGSIRRSVDPGARVWLSIFFHDRFALENTLSLQNSAIAREGVTATLEMRQLTGGVRYSPVAALDESIHLYLRGGYGWLWYAANEVRAGGAGPAGSIRDGYLPTILPSRDWWPNTWYGGAGVELFSPRERWLLGRLGFGLRVESSAYFNKLSFNQASGHGDIVAKRGDLALSLIFGW